MTRVLVVEDEKDQRELTQDALELLGGFDVRAIQGGEDIIEVIREYEPDVIPMDMLMPGHDGSSILVSIREAGIKTPVIIYTAQYGPTSTEGLKHLVKVLGGQDFILKPYDIDELVAKVMKWAGG
jgi:CheY-like chemotaxis protein